MFTQKVILIGAFLFLLVFPAFSQLQLQLEVRPRSEYRHGFKRLANLDQEPAFFTDQRTRFTGLFSEDDLSVKISLQDIRVWGNQPQLVVGDGNLTSVHEAWAKFKVASNLALKLGRQEISYDDQRIFGAVGWAQQARSHDAAVLIFQDSSFTGHLGLAFNQASPRLISTIYTVNNNYKALQYLWMNKKFGRANLSVLFLNNGLQALNDSGEAVGTNFSQTVGGRFGYKLSNVQINTAAYYQTGEMGNEVGTNINAYYAALDVTVPISEAHRITIGGEILSGNDQNSTDDTNRAFTPFYGTNHKFNGLMDYFFVGNHINNVGLNDLFVKLAMKTGKVNTGVHAHFFTANGNVADVSGDDMSAYLGTEVDLTASFPVAKGVALAAGYSQMFGSNTLVSIQNGGATEATSNWAWVMVTIKPSFKIR